MTPTLPVGKRRLRHVAVLWAALRQTVAYQCLRNCATEIKAQGCVEHLVCGGGGLFIARVMSIPIWTGAVAATVMPRSAVGRVERADGALNQKFGEFHLLKR
jgi:hypothetical protein